MSRITDVVLTTNAFMRTQVEEFNRRLKDETDQRIESVEGAEPGWYPGGHKHLGCDVYLGAINYFPWETMIQVFQEIDWRNKAEVVLVLHGEETSAILRPGQPVITWEH